MTAVRRLEALAPADLDAVTALVEAAGRADDQDPLNEQAHLAVAGRVDAVHWVASFEGFGTPFETPFETLAGARSSANVDETPFETLAGARSSGNVDETPFETLAGARSSGNVPETPFETLAGARSSGNVSGSSGSVIPGPVVGYAQWQPENASGQIVVHPEHRRRGVGMALLDALAEASGSPAVWAFGDLPPARGFAAASGLVAVRGLRVMERQLTSASPVEPPPGVRLRGFTWADAEPFLATNAAAFAGHPEQGHFSRADLEARAAEDWFDPEGLILAEDHEGVLGFHWTKRHPDGTGEVYVLGVHPRAGGHGLGRVLLNAGLSRLADGGARRVILYVDASNARAIELYERNGFAVFHSDTLYGRAE